MSTRLPVLMYHKVQESDKPDFLTVTPAQIISQFTFLQKKGYTTIAISELISHVQQQTPLPKKPILLTFDDGYKNNFTHLYPLLKQFGFKATIFLVADYIASGTEDVETDYLHVDEIHSMDKQVVEYGLHTFSHQSYNDLTPFKIEQDILKSRKRLWELAIPLQPCHAYTYGAYPKKDLTRQQGIFEIFDKHAIPLAFRIGNRINKLPLKQKHLIERIDVRGTDPLWKFKLMCKFGKKYLF